jgi:beta-lactamase class A
MATRRSILIGTGAGLVGGALGVGPLAASARAEAMTRAVRAIEAGLKGRLGVAVLDTQTGERVRHRGAERFAMCSTFKWLAAAAVLKRADAGEESLDRLVRFGPEEIVAHSPATGARVREGMTLAALCEATVTLSDNTAGNLILKAIGGPAGFTAFARSIGDPVTRLDRWEPGLNEARPGDPRDTTSPDAMAATLRRLVLDDALSPGSRDRLAGWLAASKTGDARLRAGVPKDWRVGDKTGTGHNGTANDVGVIWPPGRRPLVVTVFITQTKAPLAERNAAIAEVARAVTRMLPT